MSVARRGSVEPEDMLRAAVPLLLLLGAAALPAWAGVFLGLLIFGVMVALGRRAPVAPAWAAGVPAAATLTMRAFGWAVSPWEQASCTVATSPAELWATGEAAVVVAAVVILAGWLGPKGGDLGLRRPPKYATRWAVMGAVLLLGVGLVGVILLARPLFGTRPLALGGTAFVVPALLYAVAAGVSEELAWRGALQAWLARTIGPWPAVLVQAVLYGVAWGVALGPLGGLLAGAAAVVLGATVVRTRTLAVALAWHVAANVPLFVLLACPTG